MLLDVRLDDFDVPIGQLCSQETGGIQFAYAPDYLGRPDAIALSCALGLTDQPFGDVLTRSFFENLQPENWAVRAAIATRFALEEDDVLDTLSAIGADCAGAVSIQPAGSAPINRPGNLETDYRLYSDRELRDIVEAFHWGRPLPSSVRASSPLAGVQGKIAVAMQHNGQLCRPQNGAPTTHILKIPLERHARDAGREHLAMTLSSQLGMATARTELRHIADIEVLLVERFDRKIDGNNVTRIHQQDFCQAIGLLPRQKYERPDRGQIGFSAKAIGAILHRTRDPAAERQAFVRATIFDMVIGNVDGHAKNLALLQTADTSLVGAPRYDVVPTMLDRNTTDAFACRLGTAQRVAELDWTEVGTFISDIGMPLDANLHHDLEAVLDGVLHPLAEHLPVIAEDDKNFADLIATNMRTICKRLGRAVPPPAADRDTFVR